MLAVKRQMDTAVLVKSCSNGAPEMVSQLSTAVTTFLFNGTMMRRWEFEADGEKGMKGQLFLATFGNACRLPFAYLFFFIIFDTSPVLSDYTCSTGYGVVGK